jgi:Mn2+/Fe2+ NRAMP family transporter
VAFFIVVACSATLYMHGHRDVTNVAEVAQALGPLAGRFAELLFAIGLINAALLSAAILPLATAYNVCEGLGFESGVDKRFSEAPAFYALYTFLIAAGAGFVLIPRLPLLKVIIYSQVANGILLPFVLVFMLLLVNREDVMGEYRNSLLGNIIAWGTSVAIVALTVLWIFTL